MERLSKWQHHSPIKPRKWLFILSQREREGVGERGGTERGKVKESETERGVGRWREGWKVLCVCVWEGCIVKNINVKGRTGETKMWGKKRKRQKTGEVEE